MHLSYEMTNARAGTAHARAGGVHGRARRGYIYTYTIHSLGVVVHRRPCSDSPKTREMRNERADTTDYTGKAHRGCCQSGASPVTEVSRCVSAPGEELKRHALLHAAGRMSRVLALTRRKPIRRVPFHQRFH